MDSLLEERSLSLALFSCLVQKLFRLRGHMAEGDTRPILLSPSPVYNPFRPWLVGRDTRQEARQVYVADDMHDRVSK